jgi:enoyl-CoA hydratase/carnithine racemase
MSEPVLLERRGQAMWITLNRPDKRNALDDEVLAGVSEGYRRAHADGEVRVIVLTGAGEKAFCAGADLAPGRSFAFDPSRPGGAYADLLRTASASSLPSIARVNGACLAGGMGLLAMTDLAVAAEGAQFGLPEVKVGLFPMQVLSLLQDLVAPRLLREWCLTGEPFDAAAARDAGLVNHVVPASELDERTAWLAARLAERSPTAIRRGKHALRAMAAMGFAEALAFGESQIALLSQTEDAREGLAAFRERRPPAWTGR